jgi:REP element-mobilizing transposase RayT
MKSNWIQTIWTTKNCEQLISKDIDNIIYELLRAEFLETGCEVRVINGTSDHVHCLFRVNAKRSLDEIIKMVKGVSSHRINQVGLIKAKFAWEKGYEPGSVGKSDFENTIEDILNQKFKHKDASITIEDEINQMHGYEVEAGV